MAELTRPERLQIMLSPEELGALDDWRFAHRMPSRASAVRELLRQGLGVKGAANANAGRASHSFGVMGDTSREDSTRNGRNK